MRGPPKPSAVDQIPSDSKMPTTEVRLLKMPKIKKTAMAVSIVASIRAKSNGLTLTRFVQNEIYSIMGAGWPALAPETWSTKVC